MKLQSHAGHGVIGRRHDEQAIVVEFAVGDGDQRLVLGAIVPAQHAVRCALGQAQVEDRLGVLGGDGDAVVVLLRFVLAGQLLEEGGRRQLPFVADDSDLACAGDRAQCVDGFDLRRFVHNQKIEGKVSGFQELCDRQGRHHEDRLQVLDDRSGLFEQDAQRLVRTLLGQFGVEDAQGTDAGITLRSVVAGAGGDLFLGQVDTRQVELTELGDSPVLAVAVECLELRPGREQNTTQGVAIGAVEGGYKRGGVDLAVMDGVDQCATAACRQVAAA